MKPLAGSARGVTLYTQAGAGALIQNAANALLRAIEGCGIPIERGNAFQEVDRLPACMQDNAASGRKTKATIRVVIGEKASGHAS